MSTLHYLSKEDFYEVRLGSMLASYDKDILSLLYQPLIGYQSLAVYFTLWSDFKRAEYTQLNKHENIFQIMNITSSEFLEARLKLEAIGLLKTYRKKENKEIDSYLYVLYSPKSPQDFFDDVIFKEMLVNKLGARQVEKLALIFSSKDIDVRDAEDITTKYSEVFSLNGDNESMIDIFTPRGRKAIDISSDFEIGELFNELKNTYQLSQDAFTTEDIREIKRLATLFGLDIVSMNEVIIECYSPNETEHLDYKKMLKLCEKMKDGYAIKDNIIETKAYQEDDVLGKKLNQMSQYSPYEYLRLKQNFVNPSPADVKILNLLSEKYGLSAPVINTLIDYTLIHCNNQLPSAYIEKCASTLVRKNVKTALDAMNALKGRSRRKASSVDTTKETTEKQQDTTEISDEDLLKMLDED